LDFFQAAQRRQTFLSPAAGLSVKKRLPSSDWRPWLLATAASRLNPYHLKIW
jgi:hypothetical protein